ncbi:hypothetical protein DYB34_014158 [Aphanomyces astaci]|uniref:GST C-terminal domain-containing protein n=1 Tax=Aphanomyces astaci TaxID=112090 RepID=A0A3R6ZQ53_APHAT|nr:hypothetical protein DYB34_014158 [Aphanomyces astaci]
MAPSTASLHMSYFAIPGRAELTCLLLAYGNIDFRDTQYTFEEYGSVKTKHVGLYPDDPFVSLEADSIVNTIVELYDATYPVEFAEKDEVMKRTTQETLNHDVFPRTLERLEQRVQGPYFAGPTITFADVFLLDSAENHVGSFPGQLKLNLAAYPKLGAIVATLHASHELKAHYAKKSE